MKLDVTFTETDQHFHPNFGEVHNVSDGGFERGYDKGYAEGETVGYEKGNSDGYANGYETGYADRSKEVFYSTYNGQPYTKKTIIPEYNYQSIYVLRNAEELEYFEMNGGGGAITASYCWAYNPKLKTAIINRGLSYTWNNREFQNCTALEYVQFGGIGRTPEVAHGNILAGCHQENLTIVVYVAAETFADILDSIKKTSPWGATNATIIYRSATTGEVITE